MKILEELWFGNICPAERADYRMEEHRRLVQLLAQNEEKLLASLNDSQKAGLEKTKDVLWEMHRLTECAAFIAGFQLAAQLMAAALTEPPRQ